MVSCACRWTTIENGGEVPSAAAARDWATRHVDGGGLGLLALGLVAAALSAVLVWTETAGASPTVDWTMFGVAAGLLLVCERQPRTWIMVAQDRAVTPLPMFAYALLLLGSPMSALGVAVVGAVAHREPFGQALWVRVAFVFRVVISVSTGGLVLFALGVRGSVTHVDAIPWRWAAAIIIAGVAMLVLDTVATELTMSVRCRVDFLSSLRRGLPARMTAVGSQLSLAPIWVIGVDSSVVLIPLLGVMTALVLASTRSAVGRAHEASHDPLTGLGNRRSFSSELDDALGGLGADFNGALLLMDLNGFKEVNDQLGHDVGDAVLVAFSERLLESVPPNSRVARVGGDEFAALLSWPKRFAAADQAIADLHAALSAPLTIQGFPVSIGTSIGVAMIPDDGKSPGELMRAADVAMYRAKRFGTRVERFHDEAGAIQTGRVGLLADLGTAVRDNQLRLDYQPQIDMRSGQVVAIEALVRWQHPEHGTIPPNDFIGLAEQTDLIGPITETVLRMATGGVLLSGDESRLSINISVRNLQDPGFAHRTLAILGATGFPPQRLELEVTERSLVGHPERARETIAELRAAGVRITVDGFGTGYASYETLRVLQVDRIKIDREFVLRLLQEPDDQAIVESVVMLAHKLGLEVVAEGVESAETWDVLAAFGCDAAQGYGIALPMPLPELRRWITQWQLSRAARPSH